MDGESLLGFVRFHAWANDKILTTTAGLSDEEFRRPNVQHGRRLRDDPTYPSTSTGAGVQFCIGNDVGNIYVWDHGFVLDDLPAIHAFCLEEDARLRGFVESLDAALNEPWVAPFARPRWLVVAHVVNHGTQHRSELAHLPHPVRA